MVIFQLCKITEGTVAVAVSALQPRLREYSVPFPTQGPRSNPLDLPDEVGINFSGTISEAVIVLERCLIREI